MQLQKSVLSSPIINNLIKSAQETVTGEIANTAKVSDAVMLPDKKNTKTQ